MQCTMSLGNFGKYVHTGVTPHGTDNLRFGGHDNTLQTITSSSMEVFLLVRILVPPPQVALHELHAFQLSVN